MGFIPSGPSLHLVSNSSIDINPPSLDNCERIVVYNLFELAPLRCSLTPSIALIDRFRVEFDVESFDGSMRGSRRTGGFHSSNACVLHGPIACIGIFPQPQVDSLASDCSDHSDH